MSLMNLPFDLNRVRAMIDEGNLSSSARQFMTDLQHIEERRRTTASVPSPNNIAQLMLMMKGELSVILENNNPSFAFRNEYIIAASEVSDESVNQENINSLASPYSTDFERVAERNDMHLALVDPFTVEHCTEQKEHWGISVGIRFWEWKWWVVISDDSVSPQMRRSTLSECLYDERSSVGMCDFSEQSNSCPEDYPSERL